VRADIDMNRTAPTIDDVTTILQVLLYGAIALILVALITVLILLRTLRRRLRVHPKTASAAPLLWNLPTGPAAQAHQRLRTASRAALQIAAPAGRSTSRGQQSIGPPPEFVALGQSIAQQSIEIERGLVAAARAPRMQRAQALAQPFAEVKRFEATVAALHTTSSQWNTAMSAPPPADVLGGIDDRLHALRSAVEDVQGRDT
jgi:hypothetical protein